MTNNSKVICTTVGPFTLYGTNLVKSCVRNGTSYCDITGEFDWVKVLIDKYDKQARETGANIINLCGHDCLPWDISVFKLAEKLKKDHNEDLIEAELFDEIVSKPSGGTVATILNSIPPPSYKSDAGFDPSYITKDQTQSKNRTTSKLTMLPTYKNNKYLSHFVMSSVNYQVIKRSNALNNYSKKLVYKESEVNPNGIVLANNTIEMVLLGCIIANPLLHFLLPNPGEGPSTKFMNKTGFLHITAKGKGSNGTIVESKMYLDKDPGYLETAHMLVESSLSIALERDNLENKGEGGVVTTANCLGNVVLKRMMDTGMEFNIETIKSKM